MMINDKEDWSKVFKEILNNDSGDSDKKLDVEVHFLTDSATEEDLEIIQMLKGDRQFHELSVRAIQRMMGYSNADMAYLLGIGLTTWHKWKRTNKPSRLGLMALYSIPYLYGLYVDINLHQDEFTEAEPSALFDFLKGIMTERIRADETSNSA